VWCVDLDLDVDLEGDGVVLDVSFGGLYEGLPVDEV
jgi:hypothetical protein